MDGSLNNLVLINIIIGFLLDPVQKPINEAAATVQSKFSPLLLIFHVLMLAIVILLDPVQQPLNEAAATVQGKFSPLLLIFHVLMLAIIIIRSSATATK